MPDQMKSSNTEAPQLDVVIVTYTRPEMVRNCLVSLLAAADEVEGMRVQVVDNNSPDGTADVVRRDFPEVELRRQSSNSGFAVANNVALRGVTAEYVLVLNPDTVLPSGTLAHLIAVLTDDPDIGVVGCRLVTEDGTFDHASKRFVPSLTDAARYFLSKRLGFVSSRYRAPDLDQRQAGDVDAVNGAFMLIRRSAMDLVGLLDERYWMYGEDLDWCTRFQAAGFRVRYDGTVSAVHLKGGSSGKARSLRLNWHFHRSMAIYYRTHFSGHNPVVDAAAYLGIIIRLIGVSVTDQLSRSRGRLLPAGT